MDPKEYSNTVFQIIGAAMTVHRNLGGGLLEPIYNEALTMELADRGIKAEAEKEIECYYKNHLMQKSYRMDIVVGDIIVELKSVQKIIPAHRAQLFNYLRLTKKPIGILINFGNNSIEGERYAYNAVLNECYLLDRDMNLLSADEHNIESWYNDLITNEPS